MFIKSIPLNKRAAFTRRPDFIADCVEDIDFGYLKSLGITTCFVDLDGTVVHRGTFEVESAVRDALKNSGLDIKIATNRPRSRSLKELKEHLSASGVIHPQGVFGKPTKRYIRAALQEYGLEPHQVVMIGDRVIQDILGANRSGIYSLLVHKLGDSKGAIDEFISSREKRFAETLEQHYPRI